MAGPDLELACEVSRLAGTPAILSGGVRSLADLERARAKPEIAEVIVGRALYDGAIDLARAVAVCRGEETTGIAGRSGGAGDPGRTPGIAGRAGGVGPRSARGNTGLTARVIPCLDVAAGRVVKGVKFQNLRDQGDPAACALRYFEDGADEIVFLDITAAPERRSTNLEWVTRTAEQVFIPLTVGGGVRSVDDGRELLLAGADKVGVNTAAVADPALLTRLAERFGSQCVVLSVDARRVPDPRNGDAATGAASGAARDAARWEVVTHGGRTGTGRDALAWIEEGVARGAGEILLTSIDADGTRAGYDLELLAAVCARVNVPVVASGGAGSVDHLADALAAGASAVLAASIFHQSDYTPEQVKRELARRGLPVRLEERA
jgi:cyclase